MESKGPSSTASATTAANVFDSRYTFDEVKLEELRKKVPWKDDPKWFKHVTVSPSAIMKMVRYGV